MKREDLRKEVFFVYVKFRRYYGPNPSYTMLYGQREQSLLNNFFKLLEKKYEVDTLGGQFYLDYFYYSFSFWHGRDATKSNGGVPYLNWCVGQKGFDRWVNRNRSWKFHAKNNLGPFPADLKFALEAFGGVTKKVSKKHVESRLMVNYKVDHFTTLNEWEEQDKKLLHNTEEGFINCLENTTLYTKKSILCARCIFKKKCKQTLLEEFPEIAKVREL